jgi:hypothetical protein
VSGSASRTYDDDLRLDTSSVDGGHAVDYAYEGDGLLTGAGMLMLGRDAQNGLVRTMTLANTTTTLDPNTFGEPASDIAKFNQTTLYSATYGRDDAGSRLRRVGQSDRCGRTSWGTVGPHPAGRYSLT